MIQRRSTLSSRKGRLRYLLLHLLSKYMVGCYLCSAPFTESDVPVRTVDLLTEHHIDGNHFNWNKDNIVLTHRKCHKQYHGRNRKES